MILEFNRDLSKQNVHANGVELAQILGMDRDGKGRRLRTHPFEKKRRVAAFDSPVLATDAYRIGRLDPVLRDTVFALFASPLRVTRYSGTSLIFDERKYPDVWGPSIDTLLFCKALMAGSCIDAGHALEIGCGSGFISKCALRRMPRLKTMTLVDLNRSALACSRENIDDPRARFVVSDAYELLRRRRYGLILCNPPYIPRPKSIEDNAYEGVGLLTFLITHAGRLLSRGGRLIVNYSSLCGGSVRRAVKRSGVRAVPMASLRVPLKVYTVLNNPRWMRFLKKHAGLRKNRCRGYDYWHTITITEIRP